ncbi:hypothetical protein MUN89_02280 [Halobacillus salinarum]|uniref:Uncharacterized protein n=1 Tax=Halobacillus salinarum TaxID=2932257 RepID=A0ABY4ELA4_9BACI|nr:hypothetical protein [Halobacillus salinarum]UOQ44802.1 hypothetical protein MUN89_02280 [Halobacillus salinarum]
MSEVETGQRIQKPPLAHEHTFAEMFDKDRFDDGIPLEELSRHLRRTKSYKRKKYSRLRLK